MQTFPARFDGECWNCGEEVYEGDDMGYLPGDSNPSCGECVQQHNEGINP